MQISRMNVALSLALGLTLTLTVGVQADPLAYADYWVSGLSNIPAGDFGTAAAALGSPSTTATNSIPDNSSVVSLGQGGWITLGFNSAVVNQGPSATNPYGYDLLVWGNSFQGGAAITAEFEAGRFEEPAFVEVAQADSQGNPIQWYLILPRIFHESSQSTLTNHRGTTPRDFTPAQLLAPTLSYGTAIVSGDSDKSASLFDGFVDCVPGNGATLAAVKAGTQSIVLDNPATLAVEGLGGTGIDLSRAVLQSSPGVPMLDATGKVQFVSLASIGLIRITDAKSTDMGETGPMMADVDGLVVLPNLGMTGLAGDANHDGVVSKPDYDVLMGHWGQAGAGVAGGDVNGDGIVSFADLQLLQNQWAKTSLGQIDESVGAWPSLTPEPATVSLLAIGAGLLGLRRRAGRGRNRSE